MRSTTRSTGWPPRFASGRYTKWVTGATATVCALSATLLLPVPRPANFGTVDQAFLGVGVNGIYLNRGQGIDLAPAVSFGDRAVTSTSADQIEPSIAVDPLNSQHLVMA